MNDDEPTARLPPIRESLRDQFKQDVNARHGSVRGHYRSETETAIEEYLHASEGGDTHDRLNRIEDRIDELTDMVGTLLRHVEKEKISTGEDSGTSDAVVADGGKKGIVERRTQNIVDRMRDRFSSGQFHIDDLYEEIEREGIHSEKTQDDYVDRFFDTVGCYPHPNRPETLFYWNGDDAAEAWEEKTAFDRKQVETRLKRLGLGDDFVQTGLNEVTEQADAD